MPIAADLPRPFQRPPGYSRFAGLLLDSKVIQRVEIAESPVKRAFRGVCPHPVLNCFFSIVGYYTIPGGKRHKVFLCIRAESR